MPAQPRITGNGTGRRRAGGAAPVTRRVAVALLVVLCLGFLSGCQPQRALPQEDTTVYPKAGPSQVEVLTIGAELADRTFENASGEPFRLADSTDGPWVLLYWESGQLSCEEALQSVDELAAVVASNGGTLLLVNKPGSAGETREQALAWLEQNGIGTQTVFDPDGAHYEDLCLACVPTVLVAGADGVLTSFASGSVPQEPALLSMLEEARTGKSARMEAVIVDMLMGSDGGIHTSSIAEETDGPTGGDVLSESQGLMMLYAARNQDSQLLEKAFGYVQAHLTSGGLAQWYSSDTNKDSTVNATLDDLRICRALLESGEHDAEAMAYAQALMRYAVQSNTLEDFYDFQLEESAGTLTLCYADFAALRMLAERDRKWRPVLNNALAVVTNGMISEEFPLYHVRYNYAEGTFESEALHMAEALLTLLHLAEVDRLPPESYAWLRSRLLEDGRLYAYYTLDGTPASDRLYESSAVYAVAALIALQQDDLPLARAALTKIEALRVHDADNPVDGALGERDGSGIYSFDQLKAMLAYQMLEMVIRDGGA